MPAPRQSSRLLRARRALVVVGVGVGCRNEEAPPVPAPAPSPAVSLEDAAAPAPPDAAPAPARLADGSYDVRRVPFGRYGSSRLRLVVSGSDGDTPRCRATLEGDQGMYLCQQEQSLACAPGDAGTWRVTQKSCATVCMSNGEYQRTPCDTRAALTGMVRPHEPSDTVTPDAGAAWVFAVDPKIAAFIAPTRAKGAPVVFLLEPVPAPVIPRRDNKRKNPG